MNAEKLKEAIETTEAQGVDAGIPMAIAGRAGLIFHLNHLFEGSHTDTAVQGIVNSLVLSALGMAIQRSRPKMRSQLLATLKARQRLLEDVEAWDRAKLEEGVY